MYSMSCLCASSDYISCSQIFFFFFYAFKCWHHIIADFSGKCLLKKVELQLQLQRGQQGMDFLTKGSIIMVYGLILARSNGLKLKHLNDGFVSYKHTAFHHTRH